MPATLSFNPVNAFELVPTDETLTSLTGYLEIGNETTQVKAYKIKTTSPKCYVVKPPSGMLTPGQTERITITAQVSRMSASPQVTDKFLVLSFVVNEHERDLDVKSLFTSKTKSDINHEVKLGVLINDRTLAMLGLQGQGDSQDERGQSTTGPAQVATPPPKVAEEIAKPQKLEDPEPRLVPQARYEEKPPGQIPSPPDLPAREPRNNDLNMTIGHLLGVLLLWTVCWEFLRTRICH